jgi:hypothetical protein
MSKITVVAVDKDGNEFPKEIDRADVEKYRQIAEAQDFGFRVIEPLTEEERMAAYPPPSGGQSFTGGVIQGITSTLPEGIQDLILGKDEKTRLEAGKPTQYGAGTAVGSVISGGAYGAAGAGIGGLLGSLLGPAGTAGGVLAGGALGGGVESYLAAPEEEKSLASAGVATGVGLIPGSAVIKPLGKLGGAIKKIAKVPGIESAAEKLVQVKDKLLRELDELYGQFDLVKNIRADPNAKPGGVDYSEVLEEEIAAKEAEILKNIQQKEKELLAIQNKETAKQYAGAGVAAGAGGGLYSGLTQIKSEEQLSELNRQAAQRAYEEAVRKKTEKLMAEGEVAAAEAGTRRLLEEQTAKKLRKLNK